jgi:serine/threonine protein kinase
VAYTSTWSYFLEHGLLPNLTWVPVIVVLFPLVLPGPPRRTLVAAILSGAMAPLALAILHLQGNVVAMGEDIVRTAIASAFGVVFAYTGARIVYRLGRDVAAARELGSYRLEEMLGRGGMGEVWKARHRMLARPAAIKLIRRELAGIDTPGGGAGAVQRFEKEAQVIAGLRSPHTINLFDFGTAADGAFYYVMELLDGVDVHTLVDRFGPVPPARAIYIVRQMCHSLSEAHARGVVHRDVKPANVFLCRYGEEVDFVKVLDFGLVKETAARPEQETALTAERSIPGTPAFLAPEQALGKEPLDGRVDVYATGCVAYWLLTGELVFTAESPLELIVKHAQETPAPPSSRTELAIPPALDRLVLSCLAKDPADRPASARALSDALAAVEGVGDWTESTANEWWARHLPEPVPSPRAEP